MSITTGLASLLIAAVLGPAPDDLLTVTARIASDKLEKGESYEIIVDYEIKDGYSASKGGIPAPLLQADIPESVALLGKELRSHRELARNEFLQEPYERLISDVPARVEFKLQKEPAADDVIGLNVLAYIGSEADDDAYFVRRRLQLKVAGDAEAEVVKDLDSSWGKSDVLQIGQKADLFTLPKADGDTVALADLIGKKNVIVTTYRAHW